MSMTDKNRSGVVSSVYSRQDDILDLEEARIRARMRAEMRERAARDVEQMMQSIREKLQAQFASQKDPAK